MQMFKIKKKKGDFQDINPGSLFFANVRNASITLIILKGFSKSECPT